MAKQQSVKKKRTSESNSLVSSRNLWIIFIVAVAGILLALYGTMKTLDVNSPLTQALGCNISEEVNCDVILGSESALMFGIPVASWGMFFYIFIALGAFVGLFIKNYNLSNTILTIGLVLAVFAIVFSLFKAYQMFQLGSLCLICSGMYLVNLLLAVFLWIGIQYEGGKVALVMDLIKHATHNFDSKLIPAVALFLVVFGIGYMVISSMKQKVESETPAEMVGLEEELENHYRKTQYDIKIAPDTPFKGAKDAPVVVHIFSDFQCPGCRQAAGILDEVYTEFKDYMKVYYLQYPLDQSLNPRLVNQIHPAAGEAAMGSVCANKQGKFWEFHDQVFVSQPILTEAYIPDIARSVGLDMTAFDACYADSTTKQRVVDDLDRGVDVGVNQTPSIYYNGRMMNSQRWSNKELHRVLVAKELELKGIRITN